MSANTPAPDYRFGRFRLEPSAQRLLVDGNVATLGPRAFDLLVVLVERAGQLVSKTELLDRVWPGLVVEENNLQVHVSALRKILGPDAITTVPGRGYRFTLQTRPADAPPSPPPLAHSLAALDAAMPSIAVLPFVNLSDDVANEYFADGLAEELLNVLSKIRGLRVASRTSAFTFKGAKADIPTVAQRLNVATILEGSVRKAGSRVRITAQLVHVATDSHLWSETYDRELDDIFAAQDDIAHHVVEAVRSALIGERADASGSERLSAEVQAAAKGRSRNAEAYRLYLQGAFFLNRYNDEDMKRAIGFFRSALDLDPQYALAWAALSSCYLLQACEAWAPLAEGAELARTAARRALDAQPDLAASHWALGAVFMCYDWDWRQAEASIRHALSLAPEDSQLCVRAATLMQNLGRPDEASALVERALALDPLNAGAHIQYGWQLAVAGRLAEAEGAYRKALDLSPRRAKIHSYLCALHLREGRLDDALREAESEVHEAFRLQGIALVQQARGRRNESDAALKELVRKYAESAAYQIAEIHAHRGEADTAFGWLERAYLQRDAGLPSMSCDLLMKNLHGDARWRSLLERIGRAD